MGMCTRSARRSDLNSTRECFPYASGDMHSPAYPIREEDATPVDLLALIAG